MDLELADVPDLIEALAERFMGYGFHRREAMHITIELMADALLDADDEMFEPEPALH